MPGPQFYCVSGLTRLLAIAHARSIWPSLWRGITVWLLEASSKPSIERRTRPRVDNAIVSELLQQPRSPIMYMECMVTTPILAGAAVRIVKEDCT